ncbi:hypothetical protein D4R89_07315 [bacterium]|nr:MAG: hypothetical protein D4R89_07315 [bacterium]
MQMVCICCKQQRLVSVCYYLMRIELSHMQLQSFLIFLTAAQNPLKFYFVQFMTRIMIVSIFDQIVGSRMQTLILMPHWFYR